MREKESTSPRSRVYPSEQGHAEDENAVSVGHGARRNKGTNQRGTGRQEGSSTRLTGKANRRELEDGQSKAFILRPRGHFADTLLARGHHPGCHGGRKSIIALVAADTRGQSMYTPGCSLRTSCPRTCADTSRTHAFCSHIALLCLGLCPAERFFLAPGDY